MQRGQVRECRAGRRLKLSCRNWGQFGGGTEEGQIGRPEERKRTEERWQQGGLCSEIARNGNGSRAESEEGREGGLDGAAGVAAAPIPVSLGEKGSFISSSGVGLESFPLSLPVPGKSAISTRAPKTRKGQCERMREKRRIYEPRSRGVKRPERSFRDLKQTRVKPPRRRRVRRD